jgi:hypothetical protein
MKPSADIKALQNKFRIWRVNPAQWVRDIFGDNIKLSNQQTNACNELGKIIAAKIKKSLDKPMTDEELRYSRYIGMNITSGMGSGKDFWASLMMYYFLSVFPEEGGTAPHGLATANTAKQLSNVLWKEAASMIHRAQPLNPQEPTSETILENLFVCQSEKIFRKEYMGKRFFFEAITIPSHATEEEQAKALTGRHSPYMLMILDEAAGLPEPVFKNIEGTLTGRVNLAVMIYNPIRSRGYVAEARNSNRWLTIRWNTEETVFGDKSRDIPLQDRNADLLERYGRESNVYRIRVLGLPPEAGTDVFIPWEWVQDAVDRDLEPAANDPVIMGLDPGAGGDNSAIVIRKGPKVLAIERMNTADPKVLMSWVMRIWRKYEPTIINVDAIGIGWKLPSDLRDLGYRVEAVDVRRTARNKDRYKLVRDELWGTLQEKFEKGEISIPNDQELIDQLSSIKIKDYDRKAAQMMPSKKELKKADSIGHSPDEADALVLTYAIDDYLLKRIGQTDEDDERDRRRPRRIRNRVTGY